MKRFRRGMFNGLFVASIIVSVAIPIQWYRSYRVADYLMGGRIAICDYWGSLRALYVKSGANDSNEPFAAIREVPGYDDFVNDWIEHYPQTRSIMGFRIGHVPWGSKISIYFISLPFWFVGVFPLILMVFTLQKIIADRRNKLDGICHVCGYDLRATPNRCPECGTIPAKKSSPQNPESAA